MCSSDLYLASAVCAKVLSRFFVVSYGIMGAAVLYGSIMALLSVMLVILTVGKIRKVHKEIGGQVGK